MVKPQLNKLEWREKDVYSFQLSVKLKAYVSFMWEWLDTNHAIYVIYIVILWK